MGAIADKVLTMRGCSLREIAAVVAEMEGDLGGDLDGEFGQFWAAWPHRVGKPAALRAFKAARKKRHRLADILAGVQRYVDSRPTYWLNPATFLNQERWNDVKAPTAPRTTADMFSQMAEHYDERSRESREDASSGPALLRF